MSTNSIQINLLPDVRKAKLRDQGNRQLAISIATVAAIGTAIAIVVLILITAAQAVQISLLTRSIANKQSQIQQDIPEAQAIATVQQHLTSLNDLNGNKVALSKFFTVFNSVANGDIAIASMGLDATNKLTITGQARNYSAASRLAEAMRASNVTVGATASTSNTPDFTNVLLAGINGDQGKASFTITANVSKGVTHGN